MNGGGAERVMSIVVNALSKKHNVYLITDTTRPSLYVIDSSVSIVNYKEGSPEVKKSVINRIWRKVWLIKRLRTIAKNLQADVVVSFKTQVNCKVLFSMLFSGIPVICSEHTNILRKRPLSWRLKRSLLYPFASAITVLTKHDLEQACCKHWKTVRMPNPCNIDMTNDNRIKDKVVFTAGRVDDWYVKGYDLLLRAWALIWSSFPDWTLKIAGQYSQKSFNYLKKIADSCGCANYEFLGYRKDVEVYMKTVSVYCLSSRVEGLPMGLIEAMNAGCCCVAYDCITGPNEIIQDGYSGILVEPENVEALSEALSKVMSNKIFCNSLSVHSKESVACYSVENVVEQWNDLFNKVIR